MGLPLCVSLGIQCLWKKLYRHEREKMLSQQSAISLSDPWLVSTNTLLHSSGGSAYSLLSLRCLWKKLCTMFSRKEIDAVSAVCGLLLDPWMWFHSHIGVLNKFLMLQIIICACHIVADCPAMSLVLVCWQIEIPMWISWVGRSTRDRFDVGD